MIHADSAWLLGIKVGRDSKDTSISETKKYIISQDIMTFKNPEPMRIVSYVSFFFLTCTAHYRV